jgi:transposase
LQGAGGDVGMGVMYRKQSSERKLFLARDPFDQIPRDNFYRGLDRLLKQMDLKWLERAFLDAHVYHREKGRPGIGPDGAFRLLLVGFFERAGTDSELARRVQDSLALRWFVGLELDRRPPGAATIARIRRAAPAEAVRKAALEVIDRCIETGLVPLTRKSK